ncbi:PREDICTED: forkhead box protein H1-like [Nanorana parkeri]|uniref:forkhead box protein H1-like n=1 Tax=Nanorana parkeri TaxID=125878 RepID=UPI000854A843|nr:PREDICTED: forkhead box protein H1-like [Nanorana parkeri]
MRGPLTLYSETSSHDVTGLVTLSTVLQDQVNSALTYDMSPGVQLWPPLTLHKDWGNWSPTTGQEPICPKDQLHGTMGAPKLTREGRKMKKIKKKNYQRHSKPPYSYLAMIALVLQNSPDKMLKLSQILKHIEILFPFFRRDYIGWKDSVRHNLSSNDCFRKVLKDPGKPQAKGNFWTVDVTRIPLDALKLQNTMMARGGTTYFIQDLSPYILHNHKYGAGGEPTRTFSPPGSLPSGDESQQSKLNTSFMIESLLQDLQDVDLADVSKSTESRRSHSQSLAGNIWPVNPLGCNSNSRLFQRSSSPNVSASQSLYSSSCASLSTISPRSSDEDSGTNIAGTSPQRSRHSTKRPREEDDDPRSVSSSDSDAERRSPREPPAKVPVLASDLPTSYTKCIPPNVVAPPTALPFFPFSQFGYYNYGSSPYMSPTYWGLVPQPGSSHPEPPCPPAPSLDLDNMLRAVPPNKSVFDVMTSHPGDVVHPAFFTQYLTRSGGPCPGQRLV